MRRVAPLPHRLVVGLLLSLELTLVSSKLVLLILRTLRYRVVARVVLPLTFKPVLLLLRLSQDLGSLQNCSTVLVELSRIVLVLLKHHHQLLQLRHRVVLLPTKLTSIIELRRLVWHKWTIHVCISN